MSDVSKRVTFWDGKIDPLIKAQTNHELVRTIHDWYQGTSDPPLPVIQEIDNRLRRLAAARQPGVTLEQAQESVRAAIKQHVWAVEGLGSVNRLIESTNAALAALPWTTAPGEDEG